MLLSHIFMKDGVIASDRYRSLKALVRNGLDLNDETSYQACWRRIKRMINQGNEFLLYADLKSWARKRKGEDLSQDIDMDLSDTLLCRLYKVKWSTYRKRRNPEGHNLTRRQALNIDLWVPMTKIKGSHCKAKQNKKKELTAELRSKSGNEVTLEDVCCQAGVSVTQVKTWIEKGNTLAQALGLEPRAGTNIEAVRDTYGEDWASKGVHVHGEWFKNIQQCSVFYGLSKHRLQRLVREFNCTPEEALIIEDKKNSGRYSWAFFERRPEMADRPGKLYTFLFQRDGRNYIKVGITTCEKVEQRIQIMSPNFDRGYTNLAVYDGMLFDCFLAEFRIICAFRQCPELNLASTNLNFDGHTETFELPDRDAIIELQDIIRQWARTADLDTPKSRTINRFSAEPKNRLLIPS